MKVISYYSSIPPKNKNFEKNSIIQYFSQGVKRAGDSIQEHKGLNYIPSDVALIQGWLHENSGDAPHIKLRRDVIDGQIKSNKYVITADSNLFLYAVGKENHPHHYLRYSANGVFPNTGNYFDTNVDPTRWKQISADHNIALKDYRTNGNHILICLQRNGGWSMGNLDVMTWLGSVVAHIRKFSDRVIIVRAHPGDKLAQKYLRIVWPNVYVSKNKDILKDLKNCWAVVTHNSSPTVAAAIEGYPIFVTDPIRSQCAEIANIDLSNIENPVLHERQQWAERISMFHWNFQELSSGKAWKHIKEYIK